MRGTKAKELRKMAFKIAKEKGKLQGFFSKLFIIVKEKIISVSEGEKIIIKRDIRQWQGYRRIYQDLKRKYREGGII